jgi:hypothetical protein
MFRLLLALIVALAFVVGRTPTVSPAEPHRQGKNQRVSPAKTDLYGNIVERAVGGYRIDVRGELYEEHNPDTAVLELRPPSS